MIIGVLAMQGAFIEHIHMFERIGVKATEVRLPAQLEGISGLVIPGGESTTVMKLINSYGLAGPVGKLAQSNMAIWGTCAGMICLASGALNPDGIPMDTLGLMDMTVRRNAFGRQVDSFETKLHISALQGGPFPAVFIRAPFIEKVGVSVEVLACLPGGEIVAARQGNLLATSFHPELTGDARLHSLFAGMAGT